MNEINYGKYILEKRIAGYSEKQIAESLGMTAEQYEELLQNITFDPAPIVKPSGGDGGGALIVRFDEHVEHDADDGSYVGTTYSMDSTVSDILSAWKSGHRVMINWWDTKYTNVISVYDVNENAIAVYTMECDYNPSNGVSDSNIRIKVITIYKYNDEPGGITEFTVTRETA